jgi:putative endopeptidase
MRRALLAAVVMALASGAAMAQPKPGDDFYAYANEAWLKTTTLPAGRASLDTTAMLRDEATVRIRTLVETAAKARVAGPSRRVGDYYAAFLDTAAIEAKGLTPIAGELAAIAAINDRKTLATHLGRSLQLDDGSGASDGLLGVWIHQGFHDGDRYVPHLVQGGLGLSAADYADPAKAAAYRTQVTATLTLAGLDDVEGRAARVLALETAIAATHASAEHTGDVFKTDNTWRRADFAARAPGMDWGAWLAAAGLAGQDEFVVWQPSAVTGVAALAGSEPLAAWRDYLNYHLIRRSAGVLPEAFREKTADRSQQAVAATTAALGQDIGRLYVAQYFPPQAKAAAREMAQNLKTAFRARLERADWMSPATREAALTKLAALEIGVGYPDRWIDYAGLEVRRDDAFGNLRRAEGFAYRQALAKLSEPVDPGEWGGLLPQWPGAIINFSPNAIQFSAGILQPPYFDPGGDAAGNYGSAGAGMAHEMSHSFDELGNLYDAKGRLGKWWTAQDEARFRAAAEPLAAQYAGYCVRPDLCVKPAQVLGEGSGDLAGMRVAYDAYVLSLGGKPDVVKDGLTGDQRFFLAFARRWRRVQTEAALERQIGGDIHAPGPYRASMVRNHEAWVRAFDVKPGDRLSLEREVKLW